MLVMNYTPQYNVSTFSRSLKNNGRTEMAAIRNKIPFDTLGKRDRVHPAERAGPNPSWGQVV
jgi:hypothetical protein